MRESEKMKTLYTNARVISPGVDMPGASVLTEDGKVIQVLSPSMALPRFDGAVDCDGQLLVPGFFDIQATAAPSQSVAEMARAAKANGVLHLLVAVHGADYDEIAAACKEVAAAIAEGEPKAARILGVHLDGPYGGTDYLEVKALSQLCAIRKVTFAVENSGAMAFAQKLRMDGIVPCCGGCGADVGELKEALQNGVRDMSGFETMGLAGVLAGLGEDGFSLAFAGDQSSKVPELIRFMFKVKSLDRLMMTVSDASVPFAEGLKQTMAVTGLSLSELIRTTALNQAESLGIRDIGRIEPGYKAEFALLDSDLNVLKTFA